MGTRSSSRFRTMAYSHGAHNEDTLQRENVSDSSDQSLSQGKEEGAVYRENVVESNDTDLAPAHNGFQKEVLETADPHFTVSKEREQKLIRKLDIRILPMIMWMYFLLGHHCYFHGFRSKSWRSTCLPSSSGNL